MMKNRFAILLMFAAILLSTTACQLVPSLGGVRGSGNVISEDRQVSNFQKVDLVGSGDLIITQGDQEALRIEAEDNIMPLLESTVQNGTLHLGPNTQGAQKSISPTKPIKYYLTVKDLTGVSTSGSGNVQADSLKTTDLTLQSSGSGNFTIHSLSANTLKATYSGSGNGDLSGQVTSQDVNISGSGKYQAGDLQSENATLTVSGSGEMTVWATSTLDVRISGSGTVQYYGQPSISQVISGSGKLQSLGSK